MRKINECVDLCTLQYWLFTGAAGPSCSVMHTTWLCLLTHHWVLLPTFPHWPLKVVFVLGFLISNRLWKMSRCSEHSNYVGEVCWLGRCSLLTLPLIDCPPPPPSSVTVLLCYRLPPSYTYLRQTTLMVGHPWVRPPLCTIHRTDHPYDKLLLC